MKNISELPISTWKAIVLMILVSCHAAAVRSAAESPRRTAVTFEAISVSMSANSHTFQPGEAMPLAITVENLGPTPITLNKPSVLFKSLEFELLRGTRVVRPQMNRSVMSKPESIELKARQTLRIDADLSELYPSSLQAGAYSVRAKYWPDGEVTLMSNSVSFTVMPLSPEGQKAFESYLAVIGAGEHADVARLANAFLEKYPESIFANQVRLEGAFALNRLRDYNASIQLYKSVVASREKRAWVLREALWRLGCLQIDHGNPKDAIETLRQVDTQHARDMVRKLEAKGNATAD